jgi:enoyl-CoA hydratase
VKTDFQVLQIADDGPARVITISRPEKLNALDAAVVAELSRALEAIPTAPEVRGVILTGAGGKAFVAGADIAAMLDLDEDGAMAFASQGHAIGEMIADLSVPVIAAVDGFALGGGCELALACDFIYASERAKFGQPEVKLGVLPGFGGTQRLARRVGMARALELCLTGETIDAGEALRIGLANRVVPSAELLPTAKATIGAIAAHGPLAVARAKQVIHRGSELPLGAANQLEVEAFAALFGTADQKEGMAAFLARRPPAFTGR